MQIIRAILIFIEAVCSLLLIGVILLQKTKREGLGLAFGAAMGEQLFGSRAGNILTKTTSVLSMIFLVNTTLLAITHAGVKPRSVVDKYQAAPMPAPPPMPTTRPPSTSTPPAWR